MTKVLVIEDELKTANSLKQGLEENGYRVELVNDGQTALRVATQHRHDLIVMDVMLPGLNGVEICRRLREQNIRTPVIMLTALGMTSDKLKGFEAGAEDYLVKPFDFEELLARIKVMLSRGSHQDSANLLTHGDVTMDLEAMEVRRAGKTVTLTAKEFSLLAYFMRNAGKVLSKEELAEKVWDLHFDTGTNFVEVYVSYLRNKIDKGFAKKLIHTRKGMGYIFRETI